MLQRIFTFVILSCLITIASPSITRAEQSQLSVKECIEKPEKCGSTSENGTTNEAEANSEVRGDAISSWDFIKALFAFIFVIILLYLLLKLLNNRNRIFQANRVIQNVGGTSLGGNRSVQVIKVGQRLLVIGVGDTVQLLTEVTDEEEKENIVQMFSQSFNVQEEFKTIVPGLFGKWKQRTTSEVENDFNKILKEEISTMSKERQALLAEWERKEQDDE